MQIDCATLYDIWHSTLARITKQKFKFYFWYDKCFIAFKYLKCQIISFLYWHNSYKRIKSFEISNNNKIWNFFYILTIVLANKNEILFG